MLATIVAFCGFYVAGSGQQLTNDASQVVLMRVGTRTVLAMQNDYKGPPEAFAMIVPVPAVLHEGDVKTLTHDVFERVEAMGAPRLVEYWEQDPCEPRGFDEGKMGNARAGGAIERDDTGGTGVKVEARFTVAEYQIVILSAKDSTGLDTWLHDQHYNIPPGAEPLLRPYVESGMKFFVAKVDPAKVAFENGRAALSPLRFHYDDDHFTLPIRLGLANSAGTQDLIVNILAPNQRYQVANYPNVTIPTNLDVKDDVKNHFGAFYAALFDRTLEQHPGAVVTEYAWQATMCDPCPGPRLDRADLDALGGDVLAGTVGDFVLTRLHARYGKDLKDDLVFAEAPAIEGGREQSDGVRPAATNNFQGRYIIRHPWIGPIRCEHPERGEWGPPPPELAQQAPPVKPALGLAFAPRGQVTLAAALVHPDPQLTQPAAGTKPKSGCGCQTNEPQDALVLGLGVAMLLVRRPGRRHMRSRR